MEICQGPSGPDINPEISRKVYSVGSTGKTVHGETDQADNYQAFPQGLIESEINDLYNEKIIEAEKQANMMKDRRLQNDDDHSDADVKKIGHRPVPKACLKGGIITITSSSFSKSTNGTTNTC